MSENNPKIVIDITNGPDGSVYSDTPVDVAYINFSETDREAYMDGDAAFKKANLIPIDIENEPEEPEGFGFVVSPTSNEVNENFVNEVFDYTSSPKRMSQYSDIVQKFLDSEDLLGDSEGDDD